ncbi:MAG: hypothetical protein SX243_15795 [Acidobacteriota bacterium]|nr:hypothetical protein [Acidobacteriota bacterium]
MADVDALAKPDRETLVVSPKFLTIPGKCSGKMEGIGSSDSELRPQLGSEIDDGSRESSSAEISAGKEPIKLCQEFVVSILHRFDPALKTAEGRDTNLWSRFVPGIESSPDRLANRLLGLYQVDDQTAI